MKWLAVVSTAALCALASSTVAAADEGKAFECNGLFTGATINKVAVPANGSCTLVNSTVVGGVDVKAGAYFEADGTSIGGNVKGKGAGTIYIHNNSDVGENVQSTGSVQLFLFDGSVGENVIAGSSVSNTGHVQICGMSIGNNVQVKKGGTDILVGDSANGCGGNTIGRNVQITSNFTDVELNVQNNVIGGNLTVSNNQGPSDKWVMNNSGGGKLQCASNDGPFTGSPNSGFTVKPGGQCTL